MTFDPAVATDAPSLLYLLKQVELAVRGHLDLLVRPHGVTVSQYTALTVLDRRAGLTAAALARSSFVTTQSVADVVLALERRGLVRRSRDTTDGRRILIDLTEAGREVLVELSAPVAELEDRMLGTLGTRATERLRTALDRCRTNLR